MRKLLIALLLLVSLSALAVLGLPRVIDAQMNSVASPPPYPASASAQKLHQGLFVADLHDDALLWERDLLKRYDYGHSDLPRMLEGRLGLQVFSTVTKTPRGLNMESNAADSDNITLLAMAQRWPRETWNSLLQRALYQAQKLQDAAHASEGRLVLIRSRADLARFIEAWDKDPQRVAGLLATEGLQPIENQLENVDTLFDAGFRIAGLTHFFDNEVGGSAHGLAKGGLTPLGRQVIARLEEKAMLVDLAHASRPLIDDVLAMATRPVLVSHTGGRGHLPRHAQPQRQALTGNRCHGRGDRHRLLEHRRVRHLGRRHRQSHPLRGGQGRRRACRPGLGLQRHRAYAIRRYRLGADHRRPARRRLRRHGHRRHHGWQCTAPAAGQPAGEMRH